MRSIYRRIAVFAWLMLLMAAPASAQRVPGAVPRLVPQISHTSRLNDIAFSPDGQLLATAGMDGAARLWHAESGALLHTFRGLSSDFAEVLFSPDGRALAINDGYEAAVLWSLITGERLGRLDAAVASLVFSPDGEYLLVTEDGGGGHLWSARTGAEEPFSDESGLGARGSVFTPDGQRLLTLDADGNTRLRSFPAGTVERVFPAPLMKGNDPAISPDGAYVATAGDGGVAYVWSAQTGAQVHALAGHRNRWGAPATEYEPAFLRVAGFSPDGRQLLTTAADGSARLWATRTGALLHTLGPDPEPACNATDVLPFSQDGRRVLTTCHETGRASLWSAQTGELLRTFGGEGEALIRTAALSPDGERVATADTDYAARVRSAETGAALRVLGGGASNVPVDHVVFSPGGEHLLVANEQRGTAHLWPLATDETHHVLGDGGPGLNGRPAFSPDGAHLAAPLNGGLYLWSAAEGAISRTGDDLILSDVTFSPDGERIATLDFDDRLHVWSGPRASSRYTLGGEGIEFRAFAFSPDGRYLLTQNRVVVAEADYDAGRLDDTYNAGSASLWSAASGQHLRTFGAGTDSTLLSAIFSPDGRQVVTLRAGGAAYVWATETGEREQDLSPCARALTENGDALHSSAFSPDGRLVLMTGDATARLCDAETGTTVHALGAPGAAEDADVDEAAFSPDGRFVVTQNGYWADDARGSTKETSLWSVQTGARLHTFPGKAASDTPFSPDGLLLLTTERGEIRLWSVESGERLRTLAEDGAVFRSIAVSPDGQHVAAGGLDGLTRLWAVETGERVATLAAFGGGEWLATTPVGRFDAPDLEAVEGAIWVAPDDPFTPLPIEAFMRDFYEPRLLPRLLAGEDFPETGSLLERNRVQPVVEIASVEAAANGTASVTVAVTSDARAYGGRQRVSGVHDVRLFRNGQLAAWTDGVVIDGAVGQRTLRYDGVALPTETASVAFSAYAFNADRVKSRTAYRTVALPEAHRERPRRTYVVSLGVNRFANPAWNLDFAANDARQYQAALADGIAGTGAFDEIVSVPLLASSEDDATNARKETLRGVFALLAGGEVEPALRARIPSAERLRTATPDDLVLVTASTHGYTDERGVFYLLPEDVPQTPGRQITPALLSAAISSDELTDWLRPVDAGELALVVDACHAAAAVEGNGFKPGPMGARGLGQLAFDKGMRVLTATQSADVALESAQLRQGLLSFALVENGLRAGQADADPGDGRIALGEWLRYGAERVPALYAEVRDGRVETYGRGGSDGVRLVGSRDLEGATGTAGATRASSTQQPALFDFRQRERAGRYAPGTSGDMLLAPTPHE